MTKPRMAVVHGWPIAALAGLAMAWAAIAAPAPPSAIVSSPPGAPASNPAAAPAPEPGAAVPVENEPPEDLRILSLTDPQWKILGQVFQRHTFEVHEPAAGAELSVKIEPAAPGGLYRLGLGGDLPVRVTVTVQSVGSPARAGLRYFVEDFYGRKAAEGSAGTVITGADGRASTELVLSDLTTFGYYHILVTATAEDRIAIGSCGVAVIHPAAENPGPKGPFGVTAPPGMAPAALAEICRRLGVEHITFEFPQATGQPKPASSTIWAMGTFGLTTTAAKPEAGAEVKPSRGLLGIGGYQFGSAATLPSKTTGDVFAKSVAEYRTALAEWLSETPAPRFVAADLETLVDVLTEGPVLAKADALGLCLDAGSSAPNLRSGSLRRSLDYGRRTAARLGVKHVYVADTGDDPAAWSPQQQAWKLVTRHVLALAGGAERVYVTAGRGIPSPLPSAAAYGCMTHLLQGTAYREALWPDVPLLEGHIFAGADRAVAVVWSWIGQDPLNPDRGALVLDSGSRLEAFDIIGRPVGIWRGTQLIVPLGEAPIYITSAELSADQLRDRLRSSRILGVAPVTVWVRSLLPSADNPDRLDARVWVQSHRPYGQDGVAGILSPGWQVRQTKVGASTGAGQAREIDFDLERVAPAAGETPPPAAKPPYELAVTVSLGAEWVRRTLSALPTPITERTIDVGYGLAAWAGLDPVVMANEAGTVRAEVRTAWDAGFFYFCAAVHRQRDSFKQGRFASDGDAIQLAWGLDDRADDDFGSVGRGAAFPAGAFRDTDHLMALTFTKDGPRVIRLRGPHIMLRDRVPGNLDSWYGPVEGAKAEIARDAAAKVTIYEAAIPMKALAGLKPERGRAFRFAFRIGDAGNPPLEWSAAAGVPDFLAGPGSFLPLSATEGLPCQAAWRLVGPIKGEKGTEKK
jgi:hypothetical protein